MISQYSCRAHKPPSADETAPLAEPFQGNSGRMSIQALSWFLVGPGAKPPMIRSAWAVMFLCRRSSLICSTGRSRQFSASVTKSEMPWFVVKVGAMLGDHPCPFQPMVAVWEGGDERFEPIDIPSTEVPVGGVGQRSSSPMAGKPEADGSRVARSPCR
jgi:hypothetical protein